MGLEDLAMLAAVQGSTVLYPSDGTSTAALVEQMTKTSGVSYLRTTRGAYPVLYGADEQLPVGGSKTLRSSQDHAVTLTGAGVTLPAALSSPGSLPEQGSTACVVAASLLEP